jgi:hypothetical protein
MLPFLAEGDCSSAPDCLPQNVDWRPLFPEYSLSLNPRTPPKESKVTSRQDPVEVRELLVNDRLSHFHGTCCSNEFLWFLLPVTIKMYLFLRCFLLFVAPYLFYIRNSVFRLTFAVSHPCVIVPNFIYITIFWTIHLRQISILKSLILSVITPCQVNRRFGRTCRLNLQGRKISRSGN